MIRRTELTDNLPNGYLYLENVKIEYPHLRPYVKPGDNTPTYSALIKWHRESEVSSKLHKFMVSNLEENFRLLLQENNERYKNIIGKIKEIVNSRSLVISERDSRSFFGWGESLSIVRKHISEEDTLFFMVKSELKPDLFRESIGGDLVEISLDVDIDRYFSTGTLCDVLIKLELSKISYESKFKPKLSAIISKY